MWWLRAIGPLLKSDPEVISNVLIKWKIKSLIQYTVHVYKMAGRVKNGFQSTCPITPFFFLDCHFLLRIFSHCPFALQSSVLWLAEMYIVWICLTTCCLGTWLISCKCVLSHNILRPIYLGLTHSCFPCGTPSHHWSCFANIIMPLVFISSSWQFQMRPWGGQHGATGNSGQRPWWRWL